MDDTERQAPTWAASGVWTNEREIRINSLFPQATWGSRAVDVRRPPLIDTHINPAGVTRSTLIQQFEKPSLCER
jgi:hypothetical protein